MMNFVLLNRSLHQYPKSFFEFYGVEGRLTGLDETCLGTAF